MDVKTVCLGMLTDGPASGYDLKKRFESSFGHFFQAGYGSIYPALATLARNGHVEYELMPQDGKPDRKVYQLTPSGREELLRGLADENPSHKIRSEFLATMWFADLLSDEQIDTVLENRLAEIEKTVQAIDWFMECGCSGANEGPRFVAGFGKHVAEAIRSYIEENRDMLKKRDDSARKSAVG